LKWFGFKSFICFDEEKKLKIIFFKIKDQNYLHKGCSMNHSTVAEEKEKCKQIFYCNNPNIGINI
jgi:hypothetical protein